MPIVRIELLEGRTQEVKQRVAEEITEVVARHLESERSHIYVIFEDRSPQNWAVAGRFLPAPKSKS